MCPHNSAKKEADPVPELKWQQQRRQSQNNPGSETPKKAPDFLSLYFESVLGLLKTDFSSDNK